MRTYTNGEIVVEWRPEKCRHCGNCITGLPAVFDLEKRPWVNMTGASSDAIADQVAKCPSGALDVSKSE